MGAKNTYSVWSAEMDPEVTGRAGRELIDCGLSFKEARELRRKHEGSVVEKDDPAALAAADAEEEALTEDIFELPPAPEVTPEPLSDQVQIDLPRPFSVAKAPKKTAIRLVDDPEQVKQDAQVLDLKEAGTTWKQIALMMGWGWDGANMDGGRGRRAMLRAKRRRDAATAQMAKTG